MNIPPGVNEIDRAGVDQALADVLRSRFFRPTAQCSALLRYVVENTIAERDQNLRERVIGCEVFHRAPDYDTGNDHIVRSRAAEVRKRLALYYLEAAPSSPIRISVPSGSYRAVFDVQVPETSDRRLASLPASIDNEETAAEKPVTVAAVGSISSPQGNLLLNAWRVVAVLAVLASVAMAVWSNRGLVRRPTDYSRFWSPLLYSSRPTLIYCGGGFVYKLSDQFLDEYSQKHDHKNSRREFFVSLNPGESVPGHDLIPNKNFVPFGDLASVARVVTTLSAFKKPYDLRYGDDLAFTEFRSSPVILIGGLNNSWALKMTDNLRFVLEQDDRIVDQWHREKVWMQKSYPGNQVEDDYAIISRLNASDNGKGAFILSIAGIRMYGTRAAAEFISDPARLNEALRSLPRGWEQKNLQLVLHTKTMNDIPVSVNVEAIHSW